MNVLLLDGKAKEIETGDMNNIIVAYNKNDKMLYYKRYLKHLYSPLAGFMLQEIDKHISNLFEI